MSTSNDQRLREVIEQLQAENAHLRARVESDPSTPPPDDVDAAHWKRDSWGWTLLSTILIIIGALLAPMALVSAWAERQLTDTDYFVETFAPLADDPAVQAYIADQVTAVVNENLDASELTTELFDGIAELDLRPQAESALLALKGPAAQAIESLVTSTVERLVGSQQFSDIFERVVRRGHVQMIATMQGDPNAVINIESDGTIGIELGPIVAEVKTALIDRGIGIAERIPEVDRTIVIASSEAAPTAQTVYALTTVLGVWLPWVALVSLTAGVVVARRRMRALIWAAIAVALTALLLLALIAIGRPLTVSALSMMPADTANALYETTVETINQTTIALVVLAVVVAIVAWLTGPFRVPRRLRAAGASAATAIRSMGEEHHLTTGSVGEWLYRMRVPLYVLIALGGATIILVFRPLTLGVILSTAVIALLLIVILQVLQRPPVIEDRGLAEKELS
ncbi:hypothetical protein [Enteractinococcus helveticum]|uniref:Uncharacterized protein n=1 Tax=Enteractinococcus helveticum TaxID=1837282 RepID=A0A1B7M115_9MICC|nr:hypothetical protein [Enteractinococcus helveticum]OAV62106.1 hypothetical protein A6F49_07360 [Enteractinococcus helveticum]